LHGRKINRTVIFLDLEKWIVRIMGKINQKQKVKKINVLFTLPFSIFTS